jgi:1-acyl-sn-glycerol-3-phosphate acyltransferase
MLQKIWYRFGRSLVDMYASALFKMDVVRHAPLPEGPKIIAPNHPSTTDPALMLTLVEERASILISETLFKVPVLGRYLRAAGHIPVIHGNGRSAFEEAKALLEAGHTVVIFPEGAISPLDGGFHKAHTGVARLALSTGAPVVPVGIGLDRQRIQLAETIVDGKPEVGTWYIRGPYAVTVGEPLWFAGDVEDRGYVRSVAERIMGRIIKLAGQSTCRIAGSQSSASEVVARPVSVANVG